VSWRRDGRSTDTRVALRHPGDGETIPAMSVRRSRELKPLSSEHEQGLLLAYQIKKGLAGHGDSAGAPKDLPGLVALARRYEDTIFGTHTRAEEDLLSKVLGDGDARRLRAEHGDLRRLLEVAKSGRTPDARVALAQFADLLERHVRWEEKELFPAVEGVVAADALETIGHELEKRLVLAHGELRAAAAAAKRA
jgi:hemerythrin-like domain-containing protein